MLYMKSDYPGVVKLCFLVLFIIPSVSAVYASTHLWPCLQYMHLRIYGRACSICIYASMAVSAVYASTHLWPCLQYMHLRIYGRACSICIYASMAYASYDLSSEYMQKLAHFRGDSFQRNIKSNGNSYQINLDGFMKIEGRSAFKHFFLLSVMQSCETHLLASVV